MFPLISSSSTSSFQTNWHIRRLQIISISPLFNPISRFWPSGSASALSRWRREQWRRRQGLLCSSTTSSARNSPRRNPQLMISSPLEVCPNPPDPSGGGLLAYRLRRLPPGWRPWLPWRRRSASLIVRLSASGPSPTWPLALTILFDDK